MRQLVLPIVLVGCTSGFAVLNFTATVVAQSLEDGESTTPAEDDGRAGPVADSSPAESGAAASDAVADGSEPAEEPIVAHDYGFTRLTLADRRIEFYRRHLTGHYLAHGIRDPAWDATAQRLLEAFCVSRGYADFPDHPHRLAVADPQEIHALRQQLLDQGCRDPFLLFICTITDPQRGARWRRADLGPNQAWSDYCTQHELRAEYDRTTLALFHFILADLDRGGDSNDRWMLSRRKRYLNHFYKELMASTAPLSLADAVELAAIGRFYTDEVGVDDAQTLLAATADPLALDPARRWLARCLRGQIYVEHAWDLRGGGWGSTVQEEQWRQFAVFLQLAADELQAAWRQEPRLAEPAAEMITVSMGQNNGRDRQWFERARQADPYHAEAYDNMLWASRRRWGGDAARLWDISQQALVGDLYATGVPDQFFDGLRDIEKDEGEGWLGQHHALAWPRIIQYLDARAAQPTPNRPADWCLSQGVYLGQRAREPAAAWGYFEKLDRDADRLRQPHLAGWDRRWSPGMLRVDADPPTRDAIRQLTADLEAGRFDRVIDAADRALREQADPWIAGLYHDLRRRAIWSRDFRAGREVDLLEYGLEGWRPTRGRWSAAANQGVVARLNLDEGIRMVCETSFGNRYAAELTFVVPETFHANRYGGIGFILDPVIGRQSSRHTLITYARRREHAIYLQDPQNEDEDDLRMGEPHAEDAITLRLERWDQSVRIYVNGKLEVDRYDLREPWDREGRLAIGGWHDSEPLTYLFQSLRVRRLEASPFTAPPAGAL